MGKRIGCVALLTLLGYFAAIAVGGVTRRPRPGDLIVVLGNAVAPDGRPSPRLAARLAAAVAVWRAGLAPRLLVSGGTGPNGRDEAAAMAAWLIANGVPATAIDRDAAGVTTWATARDTVARNPRGTRVIVVSQWYHLPRAILALRRHGVIVTGGAWPRFWEWRDLYSLLREGVALPVYAVRRVDVAPPPPPRLAVRQR